MGFKWIIIYNNDGMSSNDNLSEFGFVDNAGKKLINKKMCQIW